MSPVPQSSPESSPESSPPNTDGRKRRAQKNLVSVFLVLEKYRVELVIDLSHLAMFRRQAPT